MKKNCSYLWKRNRLFSAKLILVMRLTLFFMILGILTVSAKSYSQQTNLKLDYKSASIRQILKEIEDRSNYDFVYSNDDFDVNREVDIKVNDASVEDVLNYLLEGTGMGYSMIDHVIIISPDKMSGFSKTGVIQQKSVSGSVTDSYGSPLPGVSIVIKGTTTGTITDFDGNFTLSDVSSEAILIFSFVGMKTLEVSVADQTSFDILMEEDAIGIEEIVAVGYGTQKRENLTGSVEQISGEVLESRPITNIADGLSNRVAGLNVTRGNGAPGSSSSWNIRGFTGLTINDQGNYVSSSRKPLILVDGIEQDPDLLNPEDIESISVLKDAAASAIYGSRAPYGVVLITTKSGKEGKTRFNYNNNFSFNTMIGIPEPVDGYTFATVFNEAYNNARQPALYTDETLEKIQAFMNGTGPSNSIGADGMWGLFSSAHGNTNWMDEYFKDWGFSQRHNLSVSGGLPEGKLSYYASFGFSEDMGLLKEAKNDTYNRYNYNLKVTSKVTDWFETTANVRYGQQNFNRPNMSDFTVLNSVGRSWSTSPAVNPDGVWSVVNANWGIAKGGEYFNKNDDLTSSIQLKFDPFEGFNITGNYTFNRNHNHFQRKSLTYEIPNPDGSISLGGSVPNSVAASMSSNTYKQIEGFMSYERTFGDHFAKILVGHQSEEFEYNTLSGSKSNLISQDVPSISSATGTTNLDDNIGHWSTEGYFFRLNYNYKEKYLLEINSRYDASSRFPKDTRWELFPSFSLGWNIAKENFWNIGQVNSFKLRGSYGKLGNANVANYLYLPQMSYNAKSWVMIGGENIANIQMPSIVSPNITWEKPEVINIGVDAAAFSNRLNLTYEWFQRTIKDQLAPPQQVSEVLGTNPPRLNNGVSETRGWELSVNWRDRLGVIAGKSLDYEVGLNLSDYIGYIVSFPNETGSMNGWTKGEVFGDVYGYETVGIAQDVNEYNTAGSHHRIWSQYWYPGDIIYKDTDGDGKIDGGNNFWFNKGDLQKIGNTSPRYQFGINVRFEWNNFDLDMFFEGVGKQDISLGSMYFWGIESSQWHSTVFEHHTDYYTPTNTDAFFPRVYFGGEAGKNHQTQSRYLLNGAYMRFKTLQLGYKLPKSWLNKIFLDNCRMYMSIENLAVLYNASEVDLDPMILRSGNGQIYPPQSIVSFGLNLNF